MFYLLFYLGTKAIILSRSWHLHHHSFIKRG